MKKIILFAIFSIVLFLLPISVCSAKQIDFYVEDTSYSINDNLPEGLSYDAVNERLILNNFNAKSLSLNTINKIYLIGDNNIVSDETYYGYFGLKASTYLIIDGEDTSTLNIDISRGDGHSPYGITVTESSNEDAIIINGGTININVKSTNYYSIGINTLYHTYPPANEYKSIYRNVVVNNNASLYIIQNNDYDENNKCSGIISSSICSQDYVNSGINGSLVSNTSGVISIISGAYPVRSEIKINGEGVTYIKSRFPLESQVVLNDEESYIKYLSKYLYKIIHKNNSFSEVSINKSTLNLETPIGGNNVMIGFIENDEYIATFLDYYYSNNEGCEYLDGSCSIGPYVFSQYYEDAIYKMRLQITPKLGYSLKNVDSSYFSVNGVDSSNVIFDSDTNILSVEFPRTENITEYNITIENTEHCRASASKYKYKRGQSVEIILNEDEGHLCERSEIYYGENGINMSAFLNTSLYNDVISFVMRPYDIHIVLKESTPLKSISLNKKNGSLKIGESETLLVTYNPDDTTYDKTVFWWSGNESIAIVDNGVITAVGEGDTFIQASVGACVEVYYISVKKSSLSDIMIDNGYKIDNSFVHGFKPNELVSNIKTKFDSDVVIQSNGSNIGTGSKITLKNESYTVVLYGDISGDGVINSADLLKMRQHLLGTNVLTGAYKQAASLVNGTTINSADLLRLRQYLLGTNTINQ